MDPDRQLDEESNRHEKLILEYFFQCFVLECYIFLHLFLLIFLFLHQYLSNTFTSMYFQVMYIILNLGHWIGKMNNINQSSRFYSFVY